MRAWSRGRSPTASSCEREERHSPSFAILHGIGDKGRRECVMNVIASQSFHFAYSKTKGSASHAPFHGSRNRSAIDHGSGNCTNHHARAVRLAGR
jgi:hypothetical protein